jgi:hypothetical protein
MDALWSTFQTVLYILFLYKSGGLEQGKVLDMQSRANAGVI